MLAPLFLSIMLALGGATPKDATPLLVVKPSKKLLVEPRDVKCKKAPEPEKPLTMVALRRDSPKAAKESISEAEKSGSAKKSSPSAKEGAAALSKAPKKPALTFFERLKGKKYGVGLDLSLNVVPRFFLSLFMEASHTVVSPAAAVRGVMRGRKVDFIIKGAWWNVNPTNGVWLAKGYDWGSADYIQFDPVRFYFIEVAVLWHARIADSLYFTWGAGIGGGWLSGKMHTTGAQGCRPGNYDNLSTSTSWQGSGYCYVDNYKEFWSEESFPELMGMLEGNIGLRYDLNDHLTVKVETGIFLPGFWKVSAAVEWFF